MPLINLHDIAGYENWGNRSTAYETVSADRGRASQTYFGRRVADVGNGSHDPYKSTVERQRLERKREADRKLEEDRQKLKEVLFSTQPNCVFPRNIGLFLGTAFCKQCVDPNCSGAEP